MTRSRAALVGSALLLMLAVPALGQYNPHWTLIGWNNLGMHCMDSDYSVFSILPPYNTVNACLIDSTGAFVADPGALGITVTYEAVADLAGSINTTSIGKTNFWAYVLPLYGASPAPDVGLTGNAMPGTANVPRAIPFQTAWGWFNGEGIPMTPYDDLGVKNAYPMMKLVARDASSSVLATTRVVLPVSDEMDCTACHASGSGPDAEPTAGWVNDPNPERDYRLNILLLHDERQAGSGVYSGALAAAGYDSAGLYVQVTKVGGGPILCAACHATAALGAAGYPGVPQLTTAVHSHHASVIDPTTGLTLDATANRTACYRCHPGARTRCLRGVMGSSANPDATLAIQCQSCHGVMSVVGTAGRTGWLQEPACQSCHTGTATSNNGQIRYTDAFDGTVWRTPVNQTFATNADTPGTGLDLYRFSRGHGGVQCEGCHGSTHAEYPTWHASDDLQSTLLQGHVGTIGECAACHAAEPSPVSGGPHGMHPVGQSWVESHPDIVEGGESTQCQACHGVDYRGTVLSRAFGPRTLSVFDTRSVTLWRGFTVGCYGCHQGPSNGDRNTNRPPVVQNATAISVGGAPVTIQLSASDPDGNPLTLRTVSQPSKGSAGISGTTATYQPLPGVTGTDSFHFAAWDGSIDSNLGTVTVTMSGFDPNSDGAVNVQDVFYLINYLFAGGPAPTGFADANNDGSINVGDVFYTINFLFAGGPPPA